MDYLNRWLTVTITVVAMVDLTGCSLRRSMNSEISRPENHPSQCIESFTKTWAKDYFARLRAADDPRLSQTSSHPQLDFQTIRLAIASVEKPDIVSFRDRAIVLNLSSSAPKAVTHRIVDDGLGYTLTYYEGTTVWDEVKMTYTIPFHCQLQAIFQRLS